MRSIILLTLFSSSLFADYGVARVWHLTYETKTEKCAVDIIKLTSGKYKVETNCYAK